MPQSKNKENDRIKTVKNQAKHGEIFYSIFSSDGFTLLTERQTECRQV